MSFHHQQKQISGQNKMIILTLLGYSRDYKTCNKLIQEKKSLIPHEIIRYIAEFIMYDIHSKSYTIYYETIKNKYTMKSIVNEMVQYTSKMYNNLYTDIWMVIYPTKTDQYYVMYGKNCNKCGNYTGFNYPYIENTQHGAKCQCLMQYNDT